MRRPLMLAVVVLVAFSLAFLPTPTLVLACEGGADFDPIADAAVIAGGTLVGWRPASPSGASGSPFVPIVVMMHVDRVFSGPLADQLTFIDQNSLRASGSGGSGWAGASGACGSFDADPTGKYAVMGFTRTADGSYLANRLQTFYLGDAPSGPAYEQALTRLLAVQATRLPATGTGGRDSLAPIAPGPILLVLVGIVSMLVGMRLARGSALG